MDNPAMESTGALDPNQAASVFSAMFSEEGQAPAEEPKKEEPPEPNDETEQAVEPEAEEAEAEATESEDEDPTVTIKVDGKDVEVKLSELKNGYQRQADYTKKTMEVAEQRKAAEAELQKARAEREQYANGLSQTAALLQAQLQEQQQIDWQQLLENDPQEYLRQQHLAQARQAKLADTFQKQQELNAIQQAEQQQAYQNHLNTQQEVLLAKLPEWKDEARAKADKEALKNFLKTSEFDDQEISGISDHRMVLVARKAMLYDQMMAKAEAASKKVSNLPTKAVKPSSGEPQQLDKRTSAFQRLSKSGKIDDAAAVFASIL
jgi:hypothetical protein